MIFILYDIFLLNSYKYTSLFRKDSLFLKIFYTLSVHKNISFRRKWEFSWSLFDRKLI